MASTSPGVKYRGSSSGVGISVMASATRKISSHSGPRSLSKRWIVMHPQSAYTGLIYNLLKRTIKINAQREQ